MFQSEHLLGLLVAAMSQLRGEIAQQARPCTFSRPICVEMALQLLGRNEMAGTELHDSAIPSGSCAEEMR